MVKLSAVAQLWSLHASSVHVILLRTAVHQHFVGVTLLALPSIHANRRTVQKSANGG